MNEIEMGWESYAKQLSSLVIEMIGWRDAISIHAPNTGRVLQGYIDEAEEAVIRLDGNDLTALYYGFDYKALIDKYIMFMAHLEMAFAIFPAQVWYAPTWSGAEEDGGEQEVSASD